MSNALLNAAITYAELGYSVFPCVPGGKPPMTRHGVNDATTDVDTITDWWERDPSANIGLATTGLLVVDIDGSDNDWPASTGHDLTAFGRAPMTLTPSGGRHHWFCQPCGRRWRNTASKLADKVDTRADGGYVIVPPSQISGKFYAWASGYELADPPSELPEPPEWLVALLDDGISGPSVSACTGASEIPAGHRNDSLARQAGAMRRVGMSREEIHVALDKINRDRCDPPLPHREVERIAASISRYDPDPAAVAEPDPPSIDYTPFPVEALPDPLGRFVSEAAGAIGVDPSFVALPCLTICGSAIGNTRRIRLKRGSWSEPPIIWTALVAESGSKKSPAFAHALRPVEQLERENRQAHKMAMAEYNQTIASLGKGDPKPRPPVCDRLMTADPTVEALVALLGDAPRGLLIARDELSGFVGGMDQYKGKGVRSDVGHYLSMWQGRSVTVDRKTGDPSQRSLYVPRASVSICGTIQPEIMGRVLGEQHFSDGLAARFLLAMPPRQSVKWSDSDIDSDTADAWAGLVRGLYELDWGYDKDGSPYPRPISLSDDGKREWVGFYDQWADRQAAATGDRAAALAKLEAYAARLALVVHSIREVADDPTLPDHNRIDAASVRAGVGLVHWFSTEAERVYEAISAAPEAREQSQLVALIERKGGGITVRELMRSSRRYADAESAQTALDALVEADQATIERQPPGPRGGKPVAVYRLKSAPSADRTPSGADRTPSGADNTPVGATENEVMSTVSASTDAEDGFDYGNPWE